MPIVRDIFPEATDLLIQAEQLRPAAMAQEVGQAYMAPYLAGDQGVLHAQVTPLVQCDLVVGSMDYPQPPVTVRLFDQTTIRVNGVIATPCGALVPFALGAAAALINPFVQSTTRWTLAGVTRNSSGAALGNCRVVVFETGRMARESNPFVVEGYSDGSGNYSLEVPMNVAYQAIAYLPGSPDVAGITRNDITPVSNA